MRKGWKPVVGYAGLYEVSKYGMVMSLDRVVRSNPAIGHRIQKGKLKTPTDSGEGYLVVSLYNDGVGKQHFIHRLVATAFIGLPPNENSTVNHKDGNKYNNRWNNLEWMTMHENHAHAKATGLYVGRPGKKVAQWKNGSLIAEYKNALQASKTTGICRSSIHECCKPFRDNQGHTAGGYVWKFTE